MISVLVIGFFLRFNLMEIIYYEQFTREDTLIDNLESIRPLGHAKNGSSWVIILFIFFLG